MEKKWTNQYIGLLESKPGLIIGSRESSIDQAGKDRLLEKTSFFKKVVCEIGSGSGGHLLYRAANNSDTLHIGLELRFKRVFRTAEKAETHGIKNLLVIRHNAQNIDELFHPLSLSGIYINFPDPWSRKRRWEKHRLLTEDYLRKLEKLLAPGSFISYKTDHRQRFLQVCDILNNINEFKVRKVSHDLLTSEYYSEKEASEFESLFVRKNVPIHYLYAEKV